MEIVVNKKDFLKVLDNGGVFAGRFKALPILDCVKIRIKKESISVVSTDNENAISNRIVGLDNNIEEEATFCVNYHDVKNYVRLVDGETLKLILDENTLTIKHKKGKTKMPIFPQEDFPMMSVEKEYNEVTIPSALLNNWIADGQGFTGNDESRPIMSGIYFYGDENEVGCCASEGHILFHDKMEVEGTALFNFVLNKSAFRAVCNVCSLSDGDITLRIGERNIVFSASNVSVIARQIEGKYPNFKSVIPQKYTTNAQVEKSVLIESINRCMCSANPKFPLVKIEISQNDMNLVCQDLDFNTSASEDVAVECDGSIKIGANANHILNALNIFGNNDLNMRFISESKPIIVKSEAEPNKLALVMPMALN